MLATLPVRRRLLKTLELSGSTTFIRCESSKSGNGRGGPTKARGRERQARSGLQNEELDRRDGAQSSRESTEQPSLIEQLFPEETKRYEEAQRKASREIPRLPFYVSVNRARREGVRRRATETTPLTEAQRLEEHMRRQDAVSTQTTVLVLKNASTNLVEEDFRRLIPQGKHMEGWSLEQGDIIKIIPGRNLATLEQDNFYYLLFSSKLSAFTYQGHATRISRLAASHTPSSMTSPMPPPPGYMADGMDVHAAIESFALAPASQTLDLRQLQPPLSPMVASIVRNKGYGAVTHRRENMPFEVRLTLEGPQLQASNIRFILLGTAQDRSLAWSGGDELSPKITKYEPKTHVSPMDRGSRGARSIAHANERTEEEQMERDMAAEEKRLKKGDLMEQASRRTPNLVYILGFYTELAAQRFVQYWHRRPMEWKGEGSEKDWEDDLPPVANAEMLW